jgi:hypothetical protein
MSVLLARFGAYRRVDTEHRLFILVHGLAYLSDMIDPETRDSLILGDFDGSVR